MAERGTNMFPSDVITTTPLSSDSDLETLSNVSVGAFEIDDWDTNR